MHTNWWNIVPLWTKKKSFNRSFPNGIGSWILDDTEFAQIRRRVVTRKIVNISDEDGEGMTTTTDKYCPAFFFSLRKRGPPCCFSFVKIKQR